MKTKIQIHAVAKTDGTAVDDINVIDFWLSRDGWADSPQGEGLAVTDRAKADRTALRALDLPASAFDAEPGVVSGVDHVLIDTVEICPEGGIRLISRDVAHPGGTINRRTWVCAA